MDTEKAIRLIVEALARINEGLPSRALVANLFGVIKESSCDHDWSDFGAWKWEESSTFYQRRRFCKRCQHEEVSFRPKVAFSKGPTFELGDLVRFRVGGQIGYIEREKDGAYDVHCISQLPENGGWWVTCATASQYLENLGKKVVDDKKRN